MSSIIISGRASTGHVTSSRRRSGAEKVERVFVWFIGLLLGIIILKLIFHFFIVPSVIIDKIIISTEANFTYSDEYLLEKAGLNISDTFFDINTAFIKKKLMLVPSIRSVSVNKVFPSVVKIDIASRIPVGLSLVETNNGILPALIDNEGVVYMTNNDPGSMDLPIISGLDFPEIQSGMRIPRALYSFFEDMEIIKKTAPALFDLISEIKFVRKGSIDYEVILYPRSYKTRVRIGASLDEEMLKYIIMVLEVVSVQPGMKELEEIDFRTGDVVYKVQEG